MRKKCKQRQRTSAVTECVEALGLDGIGSDCDSELESDDSSFDSDYDEKFGHLSETYMCRC